jgi:uncharacterized membrane protein
VGILVALALGWVGVKAVLVASRGNTFDPYILHNLFLSMLAAIQAPVILMSQNRQTGEDQWRKTLWAELLATQKQQLALLATLAEMTAPPT